MGVPAIAMIGVILLVVVLALFIPVFFLRINVLEFIKIEFKNNLADQVLLAFLRTKENGKTVADTIAEHKLIGLPGDIGYLKGDLDKLAGDNCYQFFVEGQVMFEGRCTPTKEEYVSETKISAPYNTGPLTLNVKLVMG